MVGCGALAAPSLVADDAGVVVDAAGDELPSPPHALSAQVSASATIRGQGRHDNDGDEAVEGAVQFNTKLA